MKACQMALKTAGIEFIKAALDRQIGFEHLFHDRDIRRIPLLDNRIDQIALLRKDSLNPRTRHPCLCRQN